MVFNKQYQNVCYMKCNFRSW